MNEKAQRERLAVLSVLAVGALVFVVIFATRPPRQPFRTALDNQESRSMASGILVRKQNHLLRATGRTCRTHLEALAAALAAYHKRHGDFPAAGRLKLLSDPPSPLKEFPDCPIGGAYRYTLTQRGAGLSCPVASQHADVGGSPADWSLLVPRPAD